MASQSPAQSPGTGRLKVALCGGGSSAHVLTAMIQSQHDVYNFLLPTEAKSWAGEVQCTINGEKGPQVVKGSGRACTTAEEAVKGADYVIMCGPVSVYPLWCKAVAPFVKPGAVVGAMYLQGIHLPSMCARLGFPKSTSYFGYQLYPYASRVNTFGASVTVLRPKVYATVCIKAAQPHTEASILATLRSFLVTPKDIRLLPHFLACVLNTGNITIHPARMRGVFRAWKGPDSTWAADEIPLFYQGFDRFSADSCDRVNQEILAVRDAISKQYPRLDLSGVKHWNELFSAYGDAVKDNSSLLAKFNSNRAYTGITTPVQALPGSDRVQVPVGHRYFQDDIPYGVCVVRYLAELFGVATPEVDAIILWAQEIMGKEYLKDGRLQGKHAAQVPLYGYTKEELVEG